MICKTYYKGIFLFCQSFLFPIPSASKICYYCVIPEQGVCTVILYLQMIDSPRERSHFEQLYNRYRGLMFQVAKKILQNEQDAEDAVHQAFLAIIKNASKIFSKNFDVNCPETRALVVIIVERKSIDLLRQRSRRPEAELDEDIAGWEFPLPGDDPLSDAMARLPARYREVLMLRFDHGYTTKEIARLFDMKQESVQKLIWRAKERLREILEQEGITV